MRRIAAVLIVAAASYAWLRHGDALLSLRLDAVTGTAHERYAAALRVRGLDATELGRAWLDHATTALAEPADIRLPLNTVDQVDLAAPEARAWRFTARRGQRITADVEFERGDVFVDLFDKEGESLASAEPGSRKVSYVAERDGPLVLRVQPELLRGGAIRVSQIAEASLEFPVRGVGTRAVQGVWGDAREGGRRRHEGIDIFAPRGTPAVAAVDGWITATGQNRLGGNVVWLWSPAHGIALYYAHLDRQAVSRGDRVSAGDVVGFVGTTGNARGTPPHLHFGIYARREGAIDPHPWVVDPVMHRSSGTTVRNR